MNEPEQPNDTRLPLTRNTGSSSFSSAPSGSDSPTTPTASIRPSDMPPSKRRRTWKTYTLWTLAAGMCLVSTLAGVLVSKFSKTELGRLWWDKTYHDPGKALSGLLKADPLANFDYKTELPPEKQHIVNVLIMGCDHDYDEKKPVPIFTTPGRSDSIIMARIDFDRRSINCLSIPRDSAVRIPGYKGLHKINGAHEFGDNELAVQTIKERFGLQADYYFSLDFESFQQIVDSIGGVTVNVHKKLEYDDNWGNLHVHLKPGVQTLDGYKAMGYVRIRHSDNDEMRSERQHEFIEALRNQIMNPANCMKLPDLLDTLTKHIKSDLTKSQMFALARFAKGLRKEEIALSTLPNVEERSYCYIPEEKARKVLADLFYAGDTGQVHLDLPSAEEVAVLNSGRIVLNKRGESVGTDAMGGGHKRRKSHKADDSYDGSKGTRANSSDEGHAVSADSPIRPPDENAADGARSASKPNSKPNDANDVQKEGSKDGTKDGTKDGSKEKSNAGDKSDTKSNNN